MLEEGADGPHVHAVHPGTEHHAVGVAHVHAGDVPGLAADLHRVVHHLPLRDVQMESRGVQGGVAHVHAGGGHLAVGGVHPDGLGALVRLDGHLLFADDVIVIEVLGHAPQGVAGHGALGPVGIEHPHPGVRLPGPLHKDDAVSPDAVVPVAEGDAQRLRTGDLPVEILQEDVVVAAGLHLGEGQLLPLRPQVADVDELRVPLVVPAGQDIRQGAGGVQRGQAGDAQLDAPVVQVDEVPDILRLRGAGEDDVVDLPGLQQLEHPVVPAQLAHHLHIGAQAPDLPGGAVGGVEAEAHLVQLPGDVDDLRLVPAVHGDQDPRVLALLHLVSGGDQALEQGLLHVLAQAQHLAGGLHLRGQGGVGVSDLLEGEHRNLHRHIGGAAVQPGAVAQGLQGLAHHDPGGQVHHGHAGDLGDVGHRPAGPGVHLDDVQLPLVDQVLDVDETPGLERQGQLLRAVDDGLEHLVADGEGRIDGDGVAGVDAGALDVLHDAGDQHVGAVGDHIHLQLLAHEILVHQDGVLDLAGEDDLHIPADLLVVVGDDHVLAADDVAGPQQHGIAQLVGRRQGLVHAQHAPAGSPLDGKPLQQLIEPLPVLCHVDGLGAGAQDGDAAAVQELGQLDGGLAAEGHHHPHRLLHGDDVHDILRVQGLEVQPVGGVVVGGDGLRVVVDDDHVIAQLLQRPDAVDGGVVELNALADADGAGAQHHDDGLAAAGEGPGLAEAVIGGVEIRRLRVELRAAGVHHLVDGVPVLRQRLAAGEAAQCLVGIAQPLALLVLLFRQAAGDGCFIFRQLPQLAEEPAVDLGDVMDLLHRDAGLQRLEHREEPVVVHPPEPLPDGGVVSGIRLAVQSIHADLSAPDGLQQGHLKAGGDGHHLAGGLHLGAQGPGGVGELVKGPLGHLHHDVVQGGLKAGAGLAGDVVFDLVQGVAQGDLGGDLGDGVAGGLGGQGRGAGHTGVHLDDRVLEALRVQSQLHVAPAHDPQVGDDVQRRLAEHLELLVRQGLGGGHHDGVAGVDAHRVQVLHGADGDDVAHAVPHGLELDLLPAEDGLLHQDLSDGRGVQAGAGNDLQLLGVLGRAAAGAAQGEGGAHDDGIADPLRHRQGLVHGLCDVGGDHRLADLRHGLLEHLPVLRPGDGRRVGAQQADPLLLEKALLVQLHGQGQARLAPQARQDGVGPLLFDDALDGLHRQGLQVDLVRHGLIRHDGGGVGVAEDHVDTGILQDTAGLGAGVVELRRLADDNGAGADHQNFLNALIQRHYRSPPFIRSTNWSNRNDVSLGPVQASGWNWTVKARRSG